MRTEEWTPPGRGNKAGGGGSGYTFARPAHIRKRLELTRQDKSAFCESRRAGIPKLLNSLEKDDDGTDSCEEEAFASSCLEAAASGDVQSSVREPPKTRFVFLSMVHDG